MKNALLVFVPFPHTGHLVPTVELAKLLVKRDTRLSITVFIIKSPLDEQNAAYLQKLHASSVSERINFVELSRVVPENNNNFLDFFAYFFDSQKPHLKEAVTKITQFPDSPRLAGLVIDLLCDSLIDVANDLGVPGYGVFPCCPGCLNVALRFQTLHDEHHNDISKFNDSDAELLVSGVVNPVPIKVLPVAGNDSKEKAEMMLRLSRSYRKTKGIMMNTFVELQPDVVSSLSSINCGAPVVYPVGPILSLNGDATEKDKGSDIIKWLDDQPSSSVVFLCFGSLGCFERDQVKEIATALERSGHRFLWCLRQSAPKGQFLPAADCGRPVDILPQGFLDRTAGTGKVIGWAPQVAVLAHPAIGGFVSHCGWSSTLESIWFDVPIATWPLYGDQQFVAFFLLTECGIAEEITMDSRMGYSGESQNLVGAEQIEKGIRKLMGMDDEKRKKVKEVSEKSRKAMEEGGSSYVALGQFIDDVFNNMP